ncbi:MAG: DUF2470 domain-containing protein [Cyanobacteriota bacterium]|nr:DUF2470 domain-containing protein [Cyanobacteriota bacterium]
MTNTIPEAVSDRICKHMNEDHADALVLYATAYGDCPEAAEATMVSIDSQGMNLQVQANGEAVPVRVKFDRDLKDAEDAHHTLVDMLKAARKK